MGDPPKVCIVCSYYTGEQCFYCSECDNRICDEPPCCIYTKCDICILTQDYYDNCSHAFTECYLYHQYRCKYCHEKNILEKEIESLKKRNSKLKSLILYCSTNIDKEIVKKIYNLF